MSRRTSTRFALLVLAPAASALTPLLALPSLLHQHGESAWAAVAVGQSIGVAVATVVELGWGLNGPQLVARRAEVSRRRLFALALVSRLVAMGPLLIAAIVVAALASPGSVLLSVLSAVGASLAGLTSTWYFIGTGAAAKVLLTDSAPRVAFSVLAVVALEGGMPGATYPILVLIAPALVSPTIAIYLVRPLFRRWSARRLASVLSAQRHAITARAVSASYIALPITFVGIVAPGIVGQFAAIERLQRMALTLLAALPSAMQPSIGAAKRPERAGMAARAVLVNLAAGVICGLAAVVLLPWAIEFVFAGAITIPAAAPWLTGLLIAVVMTSRATGGLLLVALNRYQVVSRSAGVGAVVGVPTILLLARVWGTLGALVAEIIAELCVLATQILGARRKR